MSILANLDFSDFVFTDASVVNQPKKLSDCYFVSVLIVKNGVFLLLKNLFKASSNLGFFEFFFPTIFLRISA